MKIVFLAPFGIRPKGTVIARMLPLAVELQTLGHQVIIVAPPYTNPEDSGKRETLRGVVLHNIELGPKHKVLAAPVLAWRMFKAAMSEKPDLVHLFKPKGYGGIAGMLLILLRRVGIKMPPLFLDTDDWEGAGGMNELHGYSGPEKRFYQFQEQWLSKNAVGVTVASRALEELTAGVLGGERGDGRGDASEEQIPPVPPSQRGGRELRCTHLRSQSPRILYLPNCVTEAPRGDGRAVRERLRIGPEVPVVLLYTRFFEFAQEKLHLLFRLVHSAVPQARFLVVGKGRFGEEEQLAAAAQKDGFASALILAGWVEPAELPDYLAAGDVAIYPFADNLINRTKCPAKLTELLLSGRAVVADRVGQLAEYIEGDRSGVLCDPDDWNSMAQHTIELLRDPRRQMELGEAARALLLERFNWGNAARMLERFYQSVK